MNASWDDEYLTVNEIAEHLKLNPQTVGNWIDRGELAAVRVGRRVRVRRVDLDHKLAEGATAVSPTADLAPPAAEPPEVLIAAHDALSGAHAHATHLLGRRSAVRRSELAQGLQELAEAVAAALDLLAPSVSDSRDQRQHPTRSTETDTLSADADPIAPSDWSPITER